ncbi:hypothetical protein [Nitrobacter winogradskyi]|uniref:hypothetical protein n=1 Tax=Nitrobacter winogradskyi TaxID=913 RepID=UPI00345FA435
MTGRGEVWRDNSGFFVAAFPGNLDFVRVEHGNPLGPAIGGRATTYGALPVGLAIKPPYPKNSTAWLSGPSSLRYFVERNDAIRRRNEAFAFTFGGDIIIPFKIR